MLKNLYTNSQGVAPWLYYLAMYRQFSRRLNFEPGKRDELFQRFLTHAEGKRGLQIGVKESAGRKFGPNWTSVDLYDTREFIDYNYDEPIPNEPTVRVASLPDAVAWILGVRS